MPLNSTYLAEDTFNSLREIPIDKEAASDSSFTYQTKVEIYDRMCGKCGFCRIEINTSKSTFVVDSVEKMEQILLKKKTTFLEVIRGCSYPNDVLIKNGKPVYPSLMEIVSNTCEFWHTEKMNIPSDNETEFIVFNTEAEIEGMDRAKLSELGHLRESIPCETVPQQGVKG